jgi:hypothetical protein
LLHTPFVGQSGVVADEFLVRTEPSLPIGWVDVSAAGAIENIDMRLEKDFEASTVGQRNDVSHVVVSDAALTRTYRIRFARGLIPRWHDLYPSSSDVRNFT